MLPEFVETVTGQVKIDPLDTANLNLALEEAVANVISYAYPEGTDGLVTIDACVEGNKVTFVITDNGKAFDPTAKEELDVTAGVEERPIGGLGIHLIRTIMDTVNYERKGEQNILTITKTY